MTKAYGMEFYGTYRFENNLEAVVTYNSLRDKSQMVDPSGGTYHKEYVTVGVQYHWDENFSMYGHVKFDESTLSDNSISRDGDAIGFGFGYSF
jgi:predicted porin